MERHTLGIPLAFRAQPRETKSDLHIFSHNTKSLPLQSVVKTHIQKKKFRTLGGVSVTVCERPQDLDDALEVILQNINICRGALFSSGFDYPGRHSRWDIGFVDPAIELNSKGRELKIIALNEQGQKVLSLFDRALSSFPHLENYVFDKAWIRAQIIRPNTNIVEEFRSKEPSLFSVLRQINTFFASEDAIHFGFYGAFGYDLVQQFEDIQLRHSREKGEYDCRLFLPLSLVIVDRKRETAAEISFEIETPLGSTGESEGGGERFEITPGSGSLEIDSDHEPGEFAANVAKVIEGTKRGDYFEVVLSQAFETRCDTPPLELLRILERLNPSPYLFLFNFKNEQLVGSSPEIFVRVTGRCYETCPIAGTVRRGESALEDAERVRQLIASNKEEAELTMCTDVDRNDMARVCIPGSVRVIGRRQLEFYSHLIHTVDHVVGDLADAYDALDAFQSHMWACTVTGAPKPAALQAIEDYEKSPRGWYSGAVGFLHFNGNINTGITLRTAHVKNGRASLRSGATLLFDSIPQDEEEETRTKAGAFFAALAEARRDPEATKSSIEGSQQTKQSELISGLRVPPKKVLLIDYRDSFVHNLASYLRELGSEVQTYRDGFPLEVLQELQPDLVFLSPGPGLPSDFGMKEVIAFCIEQNIPLFGVCLGHQGIGSYFGAKLKQFKTPEHGKPCLVTHFGDPIFEGIASPFEAGRYHSIYVDDLPKDLINIASAPKDGENILMALRHRELQIASVQFHPESLLSLKQHVGHRLLANVLKKIAK